MGTSLDGVELRSVSRLTAEISAHPGSNCYLMCFGNAENLAYQIGKIS